MARCWLPVAAALALGGSAVDCGAGSGGSGADAGSDVSIEDSGATGSDGPSMADHTSVDSGSPADSSMAADSGSPADATTDAAPADAGREAGVVGWGCHMPTGYAAGPGPQSPIVVDLTHDGRPDIAIVNRYDSTLGIYINSGGSSGLLQPQAIYNTGGGGGVHQVAAADINGDGWLDLGTTGVGVLWVHLNTANGTGAVNGGTAASYGSPSGGDGLAFGDFDGDGLPDFAGPVSGNDAVAVLLNQTADAGIAWGAEADYGVGDNPDFVATADLSGNHHLDLAVGNTLSQNVSILSGQGDGTFVPSQTVTAGDGGALGGPVLLKDLNADGAPDMIVGSPGGGDSGAAGFVVLLNSNDGSGGFGAPVSYAVPGGGAATAVYDMNGDGSLDVVGVVAGSAATYKQVFVMLNQNDGRATLGAPTLCAAGMFAYGTAAGDLNGDGKGDLVTANYDGTSAGTIQVILGR